jgi:hypothetical protein
MQSSGIKVKTKNLHEHMTKIPPNRCIGKSKISIALKMAPMAKASSLRYYYCYYSPFGALLQEFLKESQGYYGIA